MGRKDNIVKESSRVLKSSVRDARERLTTLGYKEKNADATCFHTYREPDVVGLDDQLPDLGRQQLSARERRDGVCARVHQLEQVGVEPDRGDSNRVITRRRQQEAVGGH